MKIKIDNDYERGCYISDRHGDEFDVPESTASRWQQAMDAYGIAQDEMYELWKTLEPQRRERSRRYYEEAVARGEHFATTSQTIITTL